MTRWQYWKSVLLEGKKLLAVCEKELDRNYRNTYNGDIMGTTKEQEEMVNHPSHYNHGNLEVIEVIDAFNHLDFNLLQAVRYILRSPFKGRIRDLEKAIWHLQHMIERMELGAPGYNGKSKLP